MNKIIPTLSKFEVENLNFKSFRDDKSEEINLKINRIIHIKSGKLDKKRFMVDLTINGVIITDKNKESKDLAPNYTLRSFSHFVNKEEILDFTDNNEIIFISITQAYALTSKMFKDRLLDVGMLSESIPVGVDFDV